MEHQDILAERLRAIRKARGLTIAEFAAELGIARSSLQSILRKTCNPRIDTLELIAKNLGLTLLELLTAPEDGHAQRIASLPPDQQKQLAEYLKQIAELLERK